MTNQKLFYSGMLDRKDVLRVCVCGGRDYYDGNAVNSALDKLKLIINKKTNQMKEIITIKKLNELSTKLKDYDFVTEMIIDDILFKIDIKEKTYIGIEGYNFGAQVGDLIDLVTFSTLLRKKLWDRVSQNILVYSPTSLKLEACKFSYQPIVKEVGKKVKRIEYEYRNKLGISGGKFIQPLKAC